MSIYCCHVHDYNANLRDSNALNKALVNAFLKYSDSLFYLHWANFAILHYSIRLIQVASISSTLIRKENSHSLMSEKKHRESTAKIINNLIPRRLSECFFNNNFMIHAHPFFYLVTIFPKSIRSISHPFLQRNSPVQNTF